jgi:ATP-dependent exoDNAse (exonuclease V) beta subunit
VPHISYSELKDWVNCAFYHKLTRIDKLKGFKGNAFTAFGTAIHSVCEKKLLKEEINDEEFFVSSFSDCIASLDDDVDVDDRLVADMVGQGKAILPEIEEAVREYFGEYTVEAVEIKLYEPIEGEDDYKFKGFIDAVVSTPDGKVHVFDWKTCGWGWDSRRRSDKMTTYQLTLYKHFFAQKMGIDPENVETHFALLKRTAKKNRVELFRVTSGPKKTENALKMLHKALYNIKNKRYIKNRLSCDRCAFRHTKECP